MQTQPPERTALTTTAVTNTAVTNTAVTNTAVKNTAVTNPAAFALLRRITTNRPAPAPGQRCEMCAEPIAEPHQHVVDVESRAILCTCRPCYLLFTESDAHLRYRAVPERYLSFNDFSLGPGQWDELEIPVALAFFFTNSTLGRTIAFYPGPAGATESELPLDAWNSVLAQNPALGLVAADTEALLIRAPGLERSEAECFLVPIDACYQLVGELRQVWRGFDGGQEARAQLTAFFAQVAHRSRPAPTTSPAGPPRPLSQPPIRIIKTGHRHG